MLGKRFYRHFQVALILFPSMFVVLYVPIYLLDHNLIFKIVLLVVRTNTYQYIWYDLILLLHVPCFMIKILLFFDNWLITFLYLFTVFELWHFIQVDLDFVLMLCKWCCGKFRNIIQNILIKILEVGVNFISIWIWWNMLI